jgi:DNA-binding transcriptional LysR family regulator
MSHLRRLLPSLNALVTFEAVVRCRNFVRAAAELCVTGPAVSRTIGRLEAHLGVALFHRTASGAVRTEQGSALFSGISGSFDEIERTILRVQQSRRSRMQTVVLSVSSAFAMHWFMPRLATFQTRFPEVDIRFQLISGPLGGPVDEVDIAMRFDHGSSARHLAHRLMPELVVPIRGPHLSGEQTPTGAFMPALDRIINFGTREPDWSGLFSDSTAAGTPNRLQFSDYSVVVQAALLGQGVALGWLNVVSHLLADGDLTPAGSVMATGRTCELVMARNPEPRIVLDICKWIGAQLEADMERIKARYPSFELGPNN